MLKNLKFYILKKKGVTLIKCKIDKNDRFDIKTILRKLYIFGCRNLLVEGGDTLTKSFIKKKTFNKFYLFKSLKKLSKSSEYLKFNSLNILNKKYKKKMKLNLNLNKDKIILYR